jgi:predicted N-acetyltransferase YhbS
MRFWWEFGMNKTQLEIRQMVRKDAEQLHKLCESFVQDYVGPLERNVKFYQRVARKKDELRLVVTNPKGQIVGYIIASYFKGRRMGRINEIVVDPSLDFVSIAGLLVEKVYNTLVHKGAATIQAPTMLNPKYAQIFPNMGFFKVETQDVFMFAINNVPRFLDEIKPIIASRLKKIQNLNGTLEIKCREQSLFFQKEEEKIHQYEWTNRDIDCRILMDEHTLAEVLLGVTEVETARNGGKVLVETSLSERKVGEMLVRLFPKRQFLALNFW